MLPTNPLLNATTPAGPHLPVGLLRQYAAGTLAPATQHRVEAHTLACPRCADILAGLQQTLPATTDQALAQLQQRLRQRVQQQAAPARFDREERRNRWLIPQLAAAAALLLGLVAGGWWAWQQRHHEQRAVPTVAVAPVATPVAPVPPTPAAPPESAVVASAPPIAARNHDYASRPVRRRPNLLAGGNAHFSHSQPALRDSAADVPSVAAPAPVADLVAVKPTPAPAVAAANNAPVVPADSSQLTRARASFDARLALKTDGAASQKALMPAAPPVAPAPAGGYSALREKLRRAATEFTPEEGERPLSGSVQLRLTIGADGKIEQLKVLHGLRADYDEEAQRLVCDGPGWIPGISSGRRAAQTVDIAVPF
jgi:outer membrane biosynthesis protein TonB